MGITDFSKLLIEDAINQFQPRSVIELGAQNLYTSEYSGKRVYAHKLYEEHGIHYECIDLNGENKAHRWDLSTKIKVNEQFELVTDFGTSEHIEKDGKHNIEVYYNCWKIKFDLLNIEGIMINENPKTGNWPGHGFNYIDSTFYAELAKISDLKIIDIGEHPAMGNSIDGWNIYCMLQKTGTKFPTINQFKKLPIYSK